MGTEIHTTGISPFSGQETKKTNWKDIRLYIGLQCMININY